MKKILILMAFVLMAFVANAQTLIDGIYYYLNSSELTATVTSVPYDYNNYSGDICIPSTVTYSGNIYSVTSIGWNAFSGCSSLTSISIPNSVKYIEGMAFNDCTNLKEVHISDIASWCQISFQIDERDHNKSSNPLSYAHDLYLNDEKVTDLVIPNGVTYIEGYAFYGCNIASVTIPKSVSSIGKYAFEGCYSLKKVIISDIEAWCKITFQSGCDYDTEYYYYYLKSYTYSNSNPLTYAHDLYLNDELLSDLVIPSGVNNINDYAFHGCSSLTSVVIPNNVKSIGDEAFSGCSNIKSVTIPPSVNSIGYNAFHNCSSLNNVVISDIAAWCGIIFRPHEIFRCGESDEGETEYVFDSYYSVYSNPLSYAHNLFLNDKLVTNLVIPDGVKNIGENAFYGCTSLTSINIPESVTSIGDGAFSDCTSLTSVIVQNPIPFNLCFPYYDHDGFYVGESNPFPNRNNSTLYVPKGSKAAYLADDYWRDFKEIVECELDNTIIKFADSKVKAICVDNWDINGDGELSKLEASAVMYIGDEDYGEPPFFESDITSFEELQYFVGLKNIGWQAFSGCSNLTSIKIPESVTDISPHAFENCTNLNSITIPNNVTSIGWEAFAGCSSLTSITIPNSVTSIEEGAFCGCTSLISIKVDTANSKYDSRNNCNAIIETSCNKLIMGCKNTFIPNSVTSIESEAFAGCTSLASITIPESVTSIGGSAFAGCTSLASITIPKSVTSIEWEAFYGCSSLTSVTIPNSVTNIESLAFYGCSSLSSIDIPNSVTRLYDEAFGNCDNLSSVNINSNAILSKAYTSSSSLKNIFGEQVTNYVVGDSVKSIGGYAFHNCTNLTSVNIPQSVTSIGDYAFSGCIGLPVENNIRYADTYLVEAVGKNQTAYQIKDGTRFIGNEAFQNCSNLALFNIPNTVSSIAVGAFSGCTNLSSVTINSNAFISQSRTQSTSLASVFGNQVEDYVIGNTVTSIGSYAFYKCSGIKSITIPASVTSIGTNAFANCERLRNVTSLNTVVPSIYSTTFPNRTNQYLYVPKNCKSVYFNADYWWEFKDIIELEEIIITFADSNTKSLCISKWDTNGDGELSETEAAAVTSLGTTFKKSQIASFNELQYFTGLTSISDGAFSKSTVGAITLPENITSIGKEAFLECKSLTSINIPSMVQTLGQNALSGCTAMTTITVDGSNTAFCDIDGVLFNKDKTTLIQFPAAKATAYDVPEGTKTIGRDAFYVSKLKTVTLPTSLEELGFDAFGYSNSLEALEIPEGITTIGDYILDGCKNVKTLHIPSTVTSIGEYMCNGCNALTDVYCAMTTPLAIAKNNFTTTAYNNATLHVPAFAVDAYKDTEGWKYFQNIVGDMASNTLLADALTINVGKTENLLVNLSNSTEIDGVQFDIALPVGLDLFVDEEGDYEISTTTRSKKLTANCTKLSNGKYRFILFSTDRAIISAGEGAIMKIKLACATDAEAGIKEIAFSGISLSCVSGNVSVNQFCDDFTSMVTIKKVSDIQGDANGDFAVNITDVMEIVNYILDMTSRTFVFDNADVDRNGVVNITDVMNVVNILLGNAIGTNAPANARTMPYDLLRISPEDYGCTLHTTFQTQKVTAMQMSVILPDDCLLESATLMGEASRTHKVLTRRIDDNRYNIVVFSTNGVTLSTDAPVLDLGIRGRGGMVNVENIQCSDINLETLLSADISTVITGIGGIIADGDNGNAPVHNTQGQRMNKPQRGINISEGRKVVVK